MEVGLFCVILFYFFNTTLCESIPNLVSHRKNRFCHTNVAKSSNIRCSNYTDIRPYEDQKKLDKDCSFHFTPESKQYFTYKVTKFKYRFVNLHFQFCNHSSTLKYTKCVIQPLEWVWTFDGFEGGEQYLDWPAEYETLSMGMLKKYTSYPLWLNVTVKGNCNIAIGQKNTTERFALAFADLYHDLAKMHDQYNYSYWCFKTRIFIKSLFLYKLCKQVICPVETIGYKCCKQIFDVNTKNMTIVCPGESFKFGSVWWICPFVIGVVLYLYFGIVLAWVLAYIYKHLDANGIDNIFMLLRPAVDHQTKGNPTESTPLLQESGPLEILWIDHNPITVLSIIASPIRRCCLIHPITTSRIIRCLLAVASLLVIFLKVSVHLIYHREFIIESVKQGAPRDFLSMIAGYHRSKDNFLIFLGGPFVALGAYIGCLIIFITVPRDLGETLVSGLPVNNSEPSSPLTMNLRLRERFGTKRVLCNSQGGYTKIHQTMLANIFSLLNPCFWGYVLNLQLGRFQYFTNRIHRGIFTYMFLIIVGTFYFFACLIELLITIAVFGFPTIFGILIVFKAYTKNLIALLGDKGSIGKCLVVFILPCIFVMLMITFYMFSIIFVDSFIFIAKVAIFTYTGLFVNPSYTEGWVIFGITIVMYIYDSIHSVNDTYEELFVQTKKVCKRKGKKLGIMQHLYKKEVEGANIPLDLYKYIVHTYKPIRVEVFVSVIKISIIIFCLYISLGILVNFDGFQELNVVTQTATTLFVSFIPKLLKRMCSLNERRKILRMRRKIDEIVESHLIYRGINMVEENVA